MKPRTMYFKYASNIYRARIKFRGENESGVFYTGSWVNINTGLRGRNSYFSPKYRITRSDAVKSGQNRGF